MAEGMALPFPPEKVRDAVEQACREHHLDSSLLGAVYAYLEEDEDVWPSCCNAGCDPCVLTLGSAARRALILLEG